MAFRSAPTRHRLPLDFPITPSLLLVLLLLLSAGGCVTRGAYQGLVDRHDQLVRERDELAAKVERLELERESFESQYVDAQDSFEDARIAREKLTRELAKARTRIEALETELAAEQSAREAREAEIEALQSTYDELVSDLESEVSAGQIKIERLKEGLRLNVSDEILFASGSAELDERGREVLGRVAHQLRELEDSIEVRGHTDDRPIRGTLARVYPSNWELAAARAARVARLLQDEGVPGSRLSVVSLGPNDPIAPNDSAENRALNRRIEIRLKPREKPRDKPQEEPRVQGDAPESAS